jgi:hypothetical protein
MPSFCQCLVFTGTFTFVDANNLSTPKFLLAPIFVYTYVLLALIISSANILGFVQERMIVVVMIMLFYIMIIINILF